MVCIKSAIWKGIIVDGIVVKLINPLKECSFGCKSGECIEKFIKETPLKEEEEEHFKKEIKEVEGEITKKEEEKMIFIDLPPFSIEKISIQLKELGMASEQCKPHCLGFCGQRNGCGGSCPVSELDINGKCGNPLERIKEPENAEEVYKQTTGDISRTFQVVLDFLLVN